MKGITIPEGVSLKLEDSRGISSKVTHENVAEKKLSLKRNESFRKGIEQAQTIDFSSFKVDQNAMTQMAVEEETVRTIDFAKEIEPRVLKDVPMLFPESITKGAAAQNLSLERAAANDNPNGAYTIALETLYTDSVTAKGEQRWYNFQLTAQKKLTVYMSPVTVATIDNDLALYKLDTTNYTLSMVSKSQNRAGMYEMLSYIADPGIYYICVTAYECSAPNNFDFLARISDTWDSSEADDSMALAEEQAIGKIVKRTLDNSLDEDCTIWLVDKDGNYRLEFFGVPENCNYQLQILNANQELLTTIAKNTSTNFKNVSAGGFFVRVLAPDGVVDPTAEYGVLIIRIPDGLTDLTRYSCWLTDNTEHFVECASLPVANKARDGFGPVTEIYVIYVDGTPMDATELDLKIYRPNPSEYSNNNCSGTAFSNAAFVGVYMGSYTSKEAAYVNGHKPRALMVTVYQGVYGSYHMMRVYDKNSWPSKPDSFIEGSDTTNVYYQGYWNFIASPIPISFVLDIDQNGRCIDLYKPNWFYGSTDFFGAVGHERPNFMEKQGFGWYPSPPHVE